jgi:two-component system, response regulator YesN
LDNIYKKLELTIAKNKYSSYVHPPYELERKLMILIKQMNVDESIQVLIQINSLERANLSKLPLISLKYSLVGSCTLFTRAVIEAGLDSETAFMLSDYYINQIDESKNKDEVEQLEYKMLKDFIQILKTHKEYIYNSTINRVISYIKKNIENKLSLEELSSLVDLHPNYLSSSFKKEVGKTITAYINEQKIEAIKLYLIHTNLSISEISYIFNFNHLSYFSAFFKTYTGLAPIEYKKHHTI